MTQSKTVMLSFRPPPPRYLSSLVVPFEGAREDQAVHVTPGVELEDVTFHGAVTASGEVTVWAHNRTLEPRGVVPSFFIITTLDI